MIVKVRNFESLFILNYLAFVVYIAYMCMSIPSLLIESTDSILYKVTFACLSIHLSVTEGQRKQFDLEAQDAVSMATEC